MAILDVGPVLAEEEDDIFVEDVEEIPFVGEEDD